MATCDGVLGAFGVLMAAGCKAPSGWDAMASGRDGFDEALMKIAASWVLILGDVGDDALMAAAVAWTRGTGKEHAFFPTPGQLLGTLAPSATAERDAVTALTSSDLALVERAYNRVGGAYGREPRSFGSAEADDRIRTTLAATGGWEAVKRAMLAEDGGFTLNAWRRQFGDVHRATASRWTVPATMAITAAPPPTPPSRQIALSTVDRFAAARRPMSEEDRAAARAQLQVVRGGK